MKAIRILIVEDVLVFAKQVKLRLEARGYSIVGIVDNGPDSIRSAAIKQPDIVLMDITLNGEMTGIEAAREIVKNSRTPIIFLIGNTDDTILETSRKISRAVFPKPFSDDELYAAIQQAIISSAMTNMLNQDEKNPPGIS